ncbi:MAG TPA: MFS transporter [Herpetosiphonaceae bacterium]
MLSLLRQRNFALLWFGALISLVGDWMIRVSLPIYIYQLTGSTLATGLMFMAGVLPQILLGSVAGVFVDRWDRKRTMVISNLLLALTLLPVLFVTSVDRLWIVYGISFISAAIAQFFAPAEHALLPQLVGEKHLLSANALNILNNNLARLIGPSLGGAAAVWFGLHTIALIDAASFAVAAGMIALIRVDRSTLPPLPARQKTTLLASWLGVWREWFAGLMLVKRSALVLSLFIVTGIMSFGEGFFPVLFVAFVKTVLNGTDLDYGWLMSAQAIGGLIGGLSIGSLGGRVLSSRLLGWSSILFGALTLVIFHAPSFAAASALTLVSVLMIIVGVVSVSCRTALNTLLQQSIADEYRGRIYGAYNTLSSCIALGGMAVAGTLGDIYGIVPIISIEGYAYILAGIVALMLIRDVAVGTALPARGQSKPSADVT